MYKKPAAGKAHLITNKYNLKYLTNFTGTFGQLFITKSKTYFITDFRYLRVAGKVLPKGMALVTAKKGLLKELIAKHKIKEVFFEAHNLNFAFYERLKKILKPTKLSPSTDFIEKSRIIKTAEEIRLIIKAQRIAEKVFREVSKNLKPGKTEQQIAWEIEQLGHEYGADTISFPPIIGFGKNSGSPHHQNSNKKLKKGELVLIDMGMKYKGYCSDMTRMVFTGKPTPKQKEIYNLVLEAQETAIKKLKANIKGNTADKWARDVITKAGYGENFGHSLGHGIGLEVHESPSLSSNYDKPIPKGTIVTVEPGIYLENSFGIRIEDMVLVKGNSVTNLTKIPK